MSVPHLRVAMDTSPYKGTELLVHLAIADIADKDGHCWAHQTTIADRARCTRQYVNVTIKKMVADGILDDVEGSYRRGRGYGNSHEYLLLPVSDSAPNVRTGDFRKSGEQTFESPVSRRDVSAERTFYRNTQEQTGEVTREQHPAPAAQEEEETVAVGQMPEADPIDWDERPKRPRKTSDDLPTPDTWGWVMRSFHNNAVNANHPGYNKKILAACIRDLRDKYGLDYHQIDIVIGTFFVKDAHMLRTSDNASVLFRHRLGALVKATSTTRTVGHKAAMDQSDRLEASAREALRQISERTRTA